MQTSKLSVLSLSLCLLLFLASPAFAVGGASDSGVNAREGSGERGASYGQSQDSPPYGISEDCDGEGQADSADLAVKTQDRDRERIRLEEHEGAQDPEGAGDRTRERTRTEERSMVATSSAVATESAEPTSGIDVASDMTAEAATHSPVVATIMTWLGDTLNFFAGLFA